MNNMNNMNNMNKVFDRVIYVNLDECIERKVEVEEQFKIINLNVERYPAINGKKLENPQEFTNRGHVFMNLGEVGCLMSHLNILKQAREDRLNNILIMEDDLVFRENANELFERTWQKVPQDWDVVYLTGNHRWEYGPLRATDNSGKNINESRDQTEGVYRVTRMLTTGMYAVNSKMFDKLISSLENYKECVDNHYCMLQTQKDLNFYTIRPYLCVQRPGYSYVRGGYRDYLRVMI